MTDATFDQSKPRPTHPIQDLSNRLKVRLLQKRRRRHLTRLLDLEDQMLDDIGVTRGDLDVVLRMPLSVDADMELRRMSLERRRRRM